MLDDLAALAGLFASAFLAATIVPAQSEAVLVGLLLAGKIDPSWLVAVASLGNTLGSLVNWIIGRYISILGTRRWFPASGPALLRAERFYRRYGVWSLLLSWVPFIGDPLTVIAGVLRTPVVTFLLLVGCAKLARYLVIASALGN